MTKEQHWNRIYGAKARTEVSWYQRGARLCLELISRVAPKPDVHVIVASFGPRAPPRRDGLEVVRYSPEGLHAEFGSAFRLLDSAKEDHRTPAGTVQPFVYCLCRVETPA
jgi:hypothetical protein